MISTWIGIGVFLSVSAANVAATKGKEDVPAPVAASEEAKPAEKVKAEPEAKKVEVKKEVSKPTIQLGAQVRPRVEKAFTGNLGVPTAPNSLAGKPNMAVSQRSRIHATIKGDGVSGKVSIQDVRGWGSEASTLKDFTGDAIDFHEAYLEFGDATKLKIGRQEIIWDDHRLIGSVNWTQQARSFDAIRLTHKQKGNFGLEAFASRLQDGQPHDLIGLHGCKHLGGVRIAVPLIFQTNLMLSDNLRGADRTDWTRFTGGIDISAGGKDKKLSWRLSAYSQNGGTEDQSISAMLVAANVGYKVSNILQPMLWVDYVSGDTDHTDDVNGSFDTLFATNHKFYGFQDRFLNVPLHTKNGGLIDIAFKNTTVLPFGKIHLAIHEFMLAAENTDGTSGSIGMEVDLTFSKKITSALSLLAGGGLFIDQGDFATARTDADLKTMHDWVFVQMNLAI